MPTSFESPNFLTTWSLCLMPSNVWTQTPQKGISVEDPLAKGISVEEPLSGSTAHALMYGNPVTVLINIKWRTILSEVSCRFRSISTPSSHWNGIPLGGQIVLITIQAYAKKHCQILRILDVPSEWKCEAGSTVIYSHLYGNCLSIKTGEYGNWYAFAYYICRYMLFVNKCSDVNF